MDPDYDSYLPPVYTSDISIINQGVSSGGMDVVTVCKDFSTNPDFTYGSAEELFSKTTGMDASNIGDCEEEESSDPSDIYTVSESGAVNIPSSD